MIQDTSHESYEKSKPDFPARQAEVVAALRFFGQANNRMIAHHVRRPINTITPTTLRLRRLGVVEEAHRALDAETDRRVIFWQLTPTT